MTHLMVPIIALFKTPGVQIHFLACPPDTSGGWGGGYLSGHILATCCFKKSHNHFFYDGARHLPPEGGGVRPVAFKKQKPITFLSPEGWHPRPLKTGMVP